MSALAGAVLAGCAAWLVTPPSAPGLHRLGPGESDRARPGRSRWVSLGAAVALAAVAVSALMRGGARAVVLGTVALALALVVQRLVQDWRDRAARRRRQQMAIELCDALAAELRGGVAGSTAVGRSCAGIPDLAPVAATARLGGDLSEALRRVAVLPGAEGLRAVAAAWEVAAHSGAALAAVLDRVAAALRHDEEARAETTAALGPPRATAKMLAVLPVFGLGLGASMGARPAAFLLGTGAGLACLSVGVLLAVAGVVWVERLAAGAEQ